MRGNVVARWIVLCIVVFGIFCVCLPTAIWNDSLSPDALLKTLELVFSWPLAILVICLVFFSRFRSSLDQFLRNVRSVQFPGGNVQMQADGSPGMPGSETIVLTPAQRDELINQMAQLEQKHLDATLGLGDMQRQRDAARIEMFQWKFQYLSVFYVESTKRILFWFAQPLPQSRQSYNQVWQTLIPDVNQRAVVLDVLLQFRMLSTDGTTISITPEGYGFLQFIGMIPYPPAQQGAG